MLYPVFLDVRDRKCVVVGGGEIAARKAAALGDSGAHVTIISPDLCAELQARAGRGDVAHVAGGYEPGVLDGAFVVVAATDDMDVNRRVSADCRARNIVVNVVDVPELCDFHVPSIIRQGDITIAIGTGGKSPALSRRLRLMLQEQVGPEFAQLLDILGHWRETVKQNIPGQKRRHTLWVNILDSGVIDDLHAGNTSQAEQKVRTMVEQEMHRA